MATAKHSVLNNIAAKAISHFLDDFFSQREKHDLASDSGTAALGVRISRGLRSY